MNKLKWYHGIKLTLKTWNSMGTLTRVTCQTREEEIGVHRQTMQLCQ